MANSSQRGNHQAGDRRWPQLALVALVFAVLGALTLLRQPPPQSAAEAPVVSRTNLLFLEGRWFQLPKTNLFTGYLVEHYPDGSLLSRSSVSNGLLNGVSEGWYTNGQIQIREHYLNSIADGRRQKWHENGQAKSEATVVQGKLEGTFRSWHENGQLAESIEMKQGHPEGTAWAFYRSGFVKAETQVRAGQVLAQQSWEDGQHQLASVAGEQSARSGSE